MTPIYTFKVDNNPKTEKWREDEYLQGRLRQGWGPPGSSLLESDRDVPFPVWRERYLAAATKHWPPEHLKKWKIFETVEKRYEILRYMLQMREDDILLIPKILGVNTVAIARVTTGYRFEDFSDVASDRVDFHHIMDVKHILSINRYGDGADGEEIWRVTSVQGSIRPVKKAENFEALTGAIARLLDRKSSATSFNIPQTLLGGSDVPGKSFVSASRFERDSALVKKLKQ